MGELTLRRAMALARLRVRMCRHPRRRQDGNLDALDCAVAIALRTPMPMAFVTTSTNVLRTDACGCAMAGEIYECGCADIPEGDCDCDGNQLDALSVRWDERR